MICGICKQEHDQAYAIDSICVRTLLARLNEWEDYFGCESPHDAFVNSTKDPHRLIGLEQARANKAENRLEAACKVNKDDPVSFDWAVLDSLSELMYLRPVVQQAEKLLNEIVEDEGCSHGDDAKFILDMLKA